MSRVGEANPNTPRAGEADARFGRTAIKFLRYMSSSYDGRTPGKFLPGHSLVSRLIAPTDPQASAAPSDPAADLANQLAAVIKSGANKFSGWDRFLIQLKTLFSGDEARAAATARLAFSKIGANWLEASLRTIFQGAASQENADAVACDVEILLKLCQKAGVGADTISEAFRFIPGFVNYDAAKKGAILRGLAKAGPYGASCVLKLCDTGKLDLNSLPRFDPNLAIEIAQGLSLAGPDGAYCLGKLIEAGKLNLASNSPMANNLIWGLSRGGEKDMALLKSLIDTGKLELNSLSRFDPYLGIEIAKNLSQAGPVGMYCLNKFLTVQEPNGGTRDMLCLQRLPRPDPQIISDIARGLSGAEEQGQACFAALVPHLPKLQGAAARQVFKVLTGAGEPGAECLWRLLNARKLDLESLSKIKGDAANQVA
ncbi:MAG: hypothetical protein LBE98_03180, partial [Puniceicoccales bacterium]|nr:hypothetical protein [Puniceicoccales bacterium]